jgi:hypothetical protein
MGVGFRPNNSMLTKELFTRIFLKQANLSTDEVNVKIHLQKWWFSTAKSTGLRLSNNGYEFLTKTLQISSYIVPFCENMELSSSVVVFLSKHMDFPYVLNEKSIIVFSERKSIELYLFSGDIRRYGLSKAVTVQKNLPKNNL